MSRVFRVFRVTQRSQYHLIEEYTLNHIWDPWLGLGLNKCESSLRPKIPNLDLRATLRSLNSSLEATQGGADGCKGLGFRVWFRSHGCGTFPGLLDLVFRVQACNFRGGGLGFGLDGGATSGRPEQIED